MTRLAAGFFAVLLLTSPAAAQPALPASAVPIERLPATPIERVPATEGRVPGSSPFTVPPAAPVLMPTFASLFTGIGQDLRHLPTYQNALIVGVAGAASLAMLESDADVTRHASTVEVIDETLDAGAVIGSGLVQGGAAMATYIIGRATHDTRLAVVGSDLVRAQLITMAFTQGLKLSVGRTRPDGTRYSFPSGHSSATFATASVLQRHYGWKAGVPAYGLAAYVAASRLSENKHYASDVIFGAALGIVAGRAVTVGHGASTFALMPIAVPKGAGIGLTLVGAQ
jgi:membrane-associated phospholipid phosphatase